ncbi:unnamed protein product [Caenorhabditis auriculariae]|uniref:Apple domain-containing protein n=1 Tax=Caenorhabditis auriculariae TaxID=2777116 RepID=A0A8S1GZH8_9PELO|nr:unnamed protein product [Caenorhabditis auriculariae]
MLFFFPVILLGFLSSWSTVNCQIQPNIKLLECFEFKKNYWIVGHAFHTSSVQFKDECLRSCLTSVLRGSPCLSAMHVPSDDQCVISDQNQLTRPELFVENDAKLTFTVNFFRNLCAEPPIQKGAGKLEAKLLGYQGGQGILQLIQLRGENPKIMIIMTGLRENTMYDIVYDPSLNESMKCNRIRTSGINGERLLNVETDNTGLAVQTWKEIDWHILDDSLLSKVILVLEKNSSKVINCGHLTVAGGNMTECFGTPLARFFEYFLEASHKVFGMDEKMKKRIEGLKVEKAYYDALQLYRTKISRFFSSTNIGQAVLLMIDSTEFFVKEKQGIIVIDLAQFFIDGLVKNKIQPSEALLATISQVAVLMTRLENEEDDPQKLVSKGRRLFADNGLRWTKFFMQSKSEKRHGSNFLHFYLANYYLKTQNLPISYWSCIARKDYALKSISSFCGLFYRFCVSTVSHAGTYPYKLPLFNFADLLLRSIAAVDIKKFTILLEEYKKELMRDRSLTQLLEKICRMYFGVGRVLNRGTGLQRILQSLTSEESDEADEATSHLENQPLSGANVKVIRNLASNSKSSPVVAPDEDDLD